MFSGKNPEISVGTSKIKIICADTVSVGLSYDTNFKWYIPILGEICRAEEKCHFLGLSPSVISGKKSTSQKHIQIDSMLRSGFFFPQNTLAHGPAFWIFFQDSRIRVNKNKGGHKCPPFIRKGSSMTVSLQNRLNIVL